MLCEFGALHFRSEPLVGLVSWIAACRIEDAVTQENRVDLQSTLPVPFRPKGQVSREGKPGLFNKRFKTAASIKFRSGQLGPERQRGDSSAFSASN